MIKIVDGLKYDTETATEIHSFLLPEDMFRGPR